MYCTPTELRKARKPHRCTNCGEAIEQGEDYVRWASYDDGQCFTNKMHPECLESLQDDADGGQFEYMPYSGDRPVVDLSFRLHGKTSPPHTTALFPPRCAQPQLEVAPHPPQNTPPSHPKYLPLSTCD
jgi:hypothetical protein